MRTSRVRLLVALAIALIVSMWLVMNSAVLLSMPTPGSYPHTSRRAAAPHDDFDILWNNHVNGAAGGDAPITTTSIALKEPNPPATTRAPCPSQLPLPISTTLPPNVAVRTPWLVVGMPSVPRRHESATTPLHTTLLYRTLTSIQDEIEGSGLPVRVVVMNMRPDAHPVFTAIKDHFKDASWLDMTNINSTAIFTTRKLMATSLVVEREFIGSNKEQPTEAARRQSYDVAALLEYVSGTSEYYYFSEDDMQFCGATLAGIHHAVTKAHARSGEGGRFAAIRFSFGLNGIVMHNGGGSLPKHNDIGPFASYLRRYGHRRPPDHLATEYFAQETTVAGTHFQKKGDKLLRRVFGFRYNLANHLGGKQSTIRDESAWSMPTCYTELTSPQVFEVEAWSPTECPNDDMWPCDTAKRYPRWSIPA